MSAIAETRVQVQRPHANQARVRQEARRYNVVDCGRRWGKTQLGVSLAIDMALRGRPVGWFAPGYKYMTEAWRDLKRPLLSVISRSSETERRMELCTGGVIEMWTLDDPDAGRSRKYARVILDEAAKSRYLQHVYEEAIRPTLTDMQGDMWMLSTPKGYDYFHTCYVRGQDAEQSEWMSWCMPTAMNPFIASTEIEEARRQLPDRVFRQEFLAEFLEDAGGVFCGVDRVISTRTATEPRRPDRDYTLGVDLARYQDFTVLTVLDSTGRQVYHERFNQISWERQIDRIVRVATLYSPGLWICIDATGVGDPVHDQVCRALSNANVEARVEPYRFNATTKEAAINSLAISIEHQSLDLLAVAEQTAELKAFAYDTTPGGGLRMNAPDGMHDDCVIALALADWARVHLLDRPRLNLVSLHDRPNTTDIDYTSNEGWTEL